MARSPSPEVDRRRDKERSSKEHKHHKERRHKHKDSDRDRSRRDGRDDGDRHRSRKDDSPREERGSSPKADELPPPPDYAPVVKESGGEVSMSIDETNKMRIALGMKPLQLESKPEELPRDVREARERRQQQEKVTKANELAHRVANARERRMQQEQLRATKTLGEADENEEDDLASWVIKSRQAEERAKAQARAKALALERQLDEQDDGADSSDDDSEGAGGGRGKRGGKGQVPSTAGLKIKAGADDLREGEMVIMTLEDKAILDETGTGLNEDEEDVLEDVGMRQQKARDKARRAAVKAKPLWNEDGITRGLLDKYDEEEEGEAMAVDEGGNVDDIRKKRQEEIRAKLAAGSTKLDDAAVSKQVASEYYTVEEAAALFKPKKMRKKKEKKMRKKDKEGGLDLDQLEAAAAAGGGGDLGSRRDREARAQREDEAMRGKAAQKRERFDRALEAANYASLALRTDGNGEDEGDEVVGEDEELYESLARARKAATSGGAGKDSVLQEMVSRRRAEEEARGEGGATCGGLEFTSTEEFVRSIQVAEEEPERAERQQEGEEEAAAPPLPPGEDGEEAPPLPPDAMEVDGGARGAGEEEEGGAGGPSGAKWGNWVSEEDVQKEAAARRTRQDAADAKAAAGPSKEEQLYKESATGPVGRERTIGLGLGGVLSVLASRGDLREGLDAVEWSGRTNDMRKQYIGQLEDVYKGGRSASRIERDVETALTRRDEFGRIMTPKEAFRNLCYDFHGIRPSKNKIDHRMKKIQESLEKKRKATSGQDTLLGGASGGRGGGSSAAGTTVDAMRSVQAATSTPYIMLSGKIKPSQVTDPSSGYATADRAEALGVAPTPVLGGGATPLTGARKVEAMLGIRKAAGGSGGGGGGSSMPPPAPKRPKQ